MTRSFSHERETTIASLARNEGRDASRLKKKKEKEKKKDPPLESVSLTSASEGAFAMPRFARASVMDFVMNG